MPEPRRVQVPFLGKMMDGIEVPVEESTERWSDITLADGTAIRVKQTVASVIRIDGQFDLEGNPIYVVRSAPAVAIMHVDDALRKRISN